MKNVIKDVVKMILVFSFSISVFYAFNDNFVYGSVTQIGLNEITNATAEQTIDNANTEESTRNFDPDKYKPDTFKLTGGEDSFKKVGGKVFGAIQVIGSFVSVFVLILIGIKYMLGSVEEKAEYKKSLLPYVIGCIMVFGIVNILDIINNIASNM